MLARFADDHDAASALYARRLALDTTAADSARERLLLMRRAMFRGRLRDAYASSDSATLRGGTGGAGIALALAEYGVMPPAAASALFASVARQADLAALPFAFPWWQRRGDTASLQSAIAAATRQQRQGTPDARGLARYAELSARSYLSLARGDTASALRGFLTLADSSMPRFLAPIRVDVARLLLATGRARDAAAYLDLRPPYPVTSSIWDVEWRVLRARAARQVGDSQRARDYYAAVAAAWAYADRELQPVVAEARGALRQFGSSVAN
jgi:eukaryotic-like serine/threonine-protein kinase